MKKMPCLSAREFRSHNDAVLLRDVTPGCEWVLAGEGVATRKWDGTACLVKGGKLFKRYDLKRKTDIWPTPPPNAIPCQEPDPITGHWPHWILVGDEPDSWMHREAWLRGVETASDSQTFELCGPRINGNPERLTNHELIPHGIHVFPLSPRDFLGLQIFLSDHHIEGLVWHHPDGRMCKLRRKDYGLEWPIKG